MYQRVFLIGNVGSDPITKNSGGGSMIAEFSLATTEKYRGEEKTTWFRIVCFKKLAELVADYVAKGSKLFVEGKIEIQDWTDKNGNKRRDIKILASSIKFVGNKSNRRIGTTNESQIEGADFSQYVPPADPNDGGGFTFDDDDIPF